MDKELKDAILEIQKGFKTITEFKTEVQNKLETFQKEQDEMNKKIKDRVVNLPGSEDEKHKGQKFSWGRAIKAIARKDWSDAPLEKEIFEATQKKDQSSETDTLGGFLVPSELSDEVIEVLRANSVLDRAGVREFGGLKGSPIELPKVTSSVAGAWIGEAAAPAVENLNFGRKALTPKEFATLVKISNRLISQTSSLADTIIKEEIGKDIALGLDTAGLTGIGSSNEPLGLDKLDTATTPTVEKVFEYILATNGRDFKFRDVTVAESGLQDTDIFRDDGKFAFITTHAVIRKLRVERIPQFSSDADGQYVGIMPAVNPNNLKAMTGYDWIGTTKLSKTLDEGTSDDNSPVFFGDWSQMIRGIWMNIILRASTEAGDSTGSAFTQNQTWIRASVLADYVVRHPSAFSKTKARTNEPV